MKSDFSNLTLACLTLLAGNGLVPKSFAASDRLEQQPGITGKAQSQTLAAAQQTSQASEIILEHRLIIDLIDGSRIIASYPDNAFSITADAAILDLPLDRIASIQFGGSNGKSLVILKNGDKVTGDIGMHTISVHTLLGPIDIPTSKIHHFNVRLRRAANPGETNRMGAHIDSPEPVVQGRPLSEWLKDLRPNTEPQHGEVIVRMGPAPETNRHSSAQAALRELGSNAVPFLLTMMRRGGQESASVIHAFATLGELGQAAVPDLLVLLDHPDAAVRNTATLSLGYIGAPVAPALPILVEECQAGNRAAVISLGRLGPAAAPAVPVLLDQLKAITEPHQRIQLVEALGRIGSSQAVGPLTDILRSSKIEPGPRGLHGLSGVLAQKAAEALGRIGPDSRDAVGDLVELLEHPGPAQLNLSARLAAIQALGAIGSHAKDAVPALEKLSKQRTHPVLIRAASSALMQIHASGP